MLRDIGRLCMLFAGLLIFTILMSPSSIARKAVAESGDRKPITLAELQVTLDRWRSSHSEFLFKARILEIRPIVNVNKDNASESPLFEAVLQVTDVAPLKDRATLNAGQIIEFPLSGDHFRMLSKWRESNKDGLFVYSNSQNVVSVYQVSVHHPYGC